MQYDPNYVYSGPTNAPLATLADSFHFAVRAAIRSRRLLASAAPRTAQFEKNADAALIEQGWSVIDNPHIKYPTDPAKVLIIADYEGRGLVVSPLMFSSEDDFNYVSKNIGSALAGVEA